MLSTGAFFALSLGLFVIAAWFFSFESGRGERLFLPGIRQWLDRALTRVTAALGRQVTHIGRHTIKLSWYYGLHKMLRALLGGLVKVYDFLEAIFLRNRDRARRLKLEKRSQNQTESHLGQMAEHKVSTALSSAEKKKLLDKKLRRG